MAPTPVGEIVKNATAIATVAIAAAQLAQGRKRQDPQIQRLSDPISGWTQRNLWVQRVDNGERLEDVAQDEGIDPAYLATYVKDAKAYAEELASRQRNNLVEW